jgi:membrane associated rhomboid family serine protease
MIPFQDNIPSRSFPILTIAIILINTVTFVYEWSLGAAGEERMVYKFGLIPVEFQIIGEGPTPLEIAPVEREVDGQAVLIRPAVERHELEGTFWGAVLPLFTCMFLHGGWMHLIGNMWFLWLFGDNVEDRLGRMRYVILYVLSGLAAGGSQVLVNWGSRTPIIGASGAVAGVLGAYLVTYPYARVRTLVPFFYFFWPVVELPAFVFLGLWLLMQFLQGAMELAIPTGAGGVAWWAHVGGFVAGIVCMKLLAPRLPDRDGPTWNELPEESN